MIKIRLSGTRIECEQAYNSIKKIMDIKECSNAYENTRKCIHSEYVRVYMDCDIREDKPSANPKKAKAKAIGKI